MLNLTIVGLVYIVTLSFAFAGAPVSLICVCLHL